MITRSHDLTIIMKPLPIAIAITPLSQLSLPAQTADLVHNVPFVPYDPQLNTSSTCKVIKQIEIQKIMAGNDLTDGLDVIIFLPIFQILIFR